MHTRRAVKIEDMFTHFDRIHEGDKQTDRQAPRVSISGAYVQHRAAKITTLTKLCCKQSRTQPTATSRLSIAMEFALHCVHKKQSQIIFSIIIARQHTDARY